MADKGDKRSPSGVAVAVALLIALVLGVVGYYGVGIHAGQMKQKQGNSAHYTIYMTDYKFTPAHMTWHAGEKVTLTLVNKSQSQPGKAHEFMMGRKPNMKQTPFGKVHVEGFQVPFFNGVHMKIVSGKGLTMFMSGGAKVSGMDPHKIVLPHSMVMKGKKGFMPVFAPPSKSPGGGRMTIQFTVPDKPGKWLYGCFQQDAQHYINGMHGTVTILGGSNS